MIYVSHVGAIYPPSLPHPIPPFAMIADIMQIRRLLSRRDGLIGRLSLSPRVSLAPRCVAAGGENYQSADIGSRLTDTGGSSLSSFRSTLTLGFLAYDDTISPSARARARESCPVALK